MVQEGQTFLWPGMSDNSEVTITDVGEGEPGLGSIGEGRVRLDQTIGGNATDLDQDNTFDIDELRQGIDPVAIQRRRSEEARQTDAAKDAPLTSDPLTWASDPSQYDFPGVDTGPTFRETEGEDFDTESFLDSLF